MTTFGESHGKGVGGVIDGMPAGVPVDMEFVQRELDRRKPGQSALVTQRREEDCVEILSGVFEGVTTGTPIGFVVYNSNMRSGDYDNLRNVFRPSHADYTYFEKYGLLYGIGFQIADDILDVKGTVDVTGKSVGIDIMEGKMTLPVIMAMRDPTYGRTIRKMISDRCDHEEILDVVRDTQSIDICERMASSYSQRAIESLEPIPESEYKDALVHLAQGVAKRSF